MASARRQLFERGAEAVDRLKSLSVVDGDVFHQRGADRFELEGVAGGEFGVVGAARGPIADLLGGRRGDEREKREQGEQANRARHGDYSSRRKVWRQRR